MVPSSSFILVFFILLSFTSTNGIQLILVNNCRENIWPGILGTVGKESPRDGGFHLNFGDEVILDVPDKWSGRIWGRQGCQFDQNGKGTCETGDCQGLLHCKNSAGLPPATVVEMTLGTSTSPLHYYDVSLVDGFNLPVSMGPIGGGVGCGVAGCEIDLNICCPSALEVKRGGKVVGCKSACLAMQSAKYCCTGDFANPRPVSPLYLPTSSRPYAQGPIAMLMMILPAFTNAGLPVTLSLSALPNKEPLLASLYDLSKEEVV